MGQEGQGGLGAGGARGAGRGRGKGSGAGREGARQAVQAVALEPNPNSKVYAQVQMQIGMSRRKWCDLILHSDSDMLVFRIEKDDAYWNRLETKLTKFFYDSLLPEIVDSRIERGLPPREPQSVIDALRAKGKPLPFDVEEEEEEGEED